MYGLSDEDLRDPGARPDVRRRADPVRGGRRAERRRAAQGRHGRARGAGQGARAAPRRTCRASSAAAAAPRCSRCWSRSRWAGSPTRSPGSASTPPSWLPAVATPYQIERFVRPADPGRARRVLRDHRGGRGLGRGRDRGDRAPGRRRLPAERREVARDVVQLGRLRVLPGQAGRRRARRRARHVPGRPAQPGRPGGAHARVLAHDQPSSPDRRVHRRPGAGLAPGRRRGRRDELRVRVVPVRAADGRGALPRRGRPADRRDDRRSRSRGGCRAGRSASSARSRRCSPTA